MDQASALALIETGLSQCRVLLDGAVAGDGGLLTALFTAGLFGGWTHCAGMCGPFVLAQVGARLERVPAARMSELSRLAGAAVLPYHLGRATTYAGIGAASALVAGSLGSLPGMRLLSAALLGFAALFFLSYAVRGLSAWLPHPGGAGGPRIGRRGSRRGSPLGSRPWNQGWADRVGRTARPLLGNPVGWRGYALGLALGFIPCGLLYGAVAIAAASGNPVTGALGMAAFALGTLPALLTVGLAGQLAARSFRALVVRAAPLVMAANAGVLGYMAWRLAV